MAVLRSRSRQLLNALRPANVHERCTRGCTSSRRCRFAWNRSRTISATVREKLRTSPSGRMQEAREHLTGPARPARHLQPAHRHGGLRRIAGEQVGDRDAVVGEQAVAGAGPRLDDRGVLRPVGHQHAPQVAVVPAEGRDAVDGALQDRLLAGRRRARHLDDPLVKAWLPLSSQRRRVGIVPDCSTHCITGNDTPSSWTNTTPSMSGSEISPGLILQQAGREGLVGAGADEPDEQGAEGSGEPGRRDGRPEGGVANTTFG